MHELYEALISELVAIKKTSTDFLSHTQKLQEALISELVAIKRKAPIFCHECTNLPNGNFEKPVNY